MIHRSSLYQPPVGHGFERKDIVIEMLQRAKVSMKVFRRAGQVEDQRGGVPEKGAQEVSIRAWVHKWKGPNSSGCFSKSGVMPKMPGFLLGHPLPTKRRSELHSEKPSRLIPRDLHLFIALFCPFVELRTRYYTLLLMVGYVGGLNSVTARFV